MTRRPRVLPSCSKRLAVGERRSSWNGDTALVFRELALRGSARHAVENPKNDFDLGMGKSGIEEHVHGHGWFGEGQAQYHPGAFLLRFSRIMRLVPMGMVSLWSARCRPASGYGMQHVHYSPRQTDSFHDHEGTPFAQRARMRGACQDMYR
mgnify:CR=1 FL=1